LKLDLNNANGKAGENYFAYWIMRNLNWPCRLLDVDIGIDAQVEIMDKAMHSTGEFLAVQIKTSITPELKTSIKVKHLKYWESINDPVMLIFISFLENEPKIYWKLINKEDTESKLAEAKKEKQKTIDIKFSQNDLLTKDSISQLLRLPYKNELTVITNSFDKIDSLWLEVVEPCYSEEYDEYNYVHYECFDLISAHQLMSYFNTACFLMDEIDDITSKHEKISSLTNDVDKIYEKYEEIKSIITGMLPDVLDNDCIHDFEFKKVWSTSDNHKIIIEMVE
jgi:hypothetical protein